MSALTRWFAARWDALDLDMQDVHFYGGLALVGFGSTRLMIVGAVLAAHAWLTPLMTRRTP